MSRILCIWELGEDLGHLSRFLPVTNELIERGHEVFFAAKDLSRIESFTWNKQVKLLQAPVWLARLRSPVITHSLAEILLYKGFQSPTTLRPLVQAWLQLFTLVKPDLIIFDHAPTALLSSSALPIPKIMFSDCFMTPPTGTPPLELRPWEPAAEGRIEQKNAHIIGVINEVCASLALPKINQFSDLFFADRYIFSTYKELDLYKDSRGDVNYIGPLPPAKILQVPRWSLSSSKIFAYFKYGQDKVDMVLDALANIGANVICYYSGAPIEDCNKRQSLTMYVSNRPFDIRSVLLEVDIVTCHAGHGMVSSCLQAGRPMILLPTQLEQRHTSVNIEKMGIGIVIDRSDSEESIASKITHFFSSPKYAENAESFAFEHRNIKPSEAITFICDACTSLLNKD